MNITLVCSWEASRTVTEADNDSKVTAWIAFTKTTHHIFTLIIPMVRWRSSRSRSANLATKRLGPHWRKKWQDGHFRLVDWRLFLLSGCGRDVIVSNATGNKEATAVSTLDRQIYRLQLNKNYDHFWELLYGIACWLVPGVTCYLSPSNGYRLLYYLLTVKCNFCYYYWYLFDQK